MNDLDDSLWKRQKGWRRIYKVLWSTEEPGRFLGNDTTDEIPRKMNGILLKVKEEPSRQND